MTDTTQSTEIQDEEMAASEQPADDLVIEDLPEDYFLDDSVHDQLPSVEEAKAGVPHPARNYKKICMIVSAFLVAVGLVVGGVVLAKKVNKQESYEFEARGEEVIRFLFDLQVSALPALSDPYHPQHEAAMFIADGDRYRMDMEGEDGNVQRFIERYVLALLYYQLNGPEWSYHLNFLSSTDHCEWWQKLSTTSGNELRMGVLCDENGYVKKLNLAYNNLQGNNIPSEISQLKQLETLHMHWNDLGGYLPDSMQHMKKLKSIGLMKTGLFGTLPAWLGDLAQLTSLGLGNNQFNGEVPSSFSKLNQMKILGLDDNKGLEGNIDLFKGMGSLEALYLENNAFSGELPAEDNVWQNLLELDVSNNMIDGSIPAAVLNHKKLVVIDIHANLMTGAFPDDIFKNDNLQVLSIYANGISGTVPDRLAFLSKLKHLDLSWNSLTGTLPDTLTQLTDMRYWATSINSFDPQEMLDLSGMTNLMDLAMKSNNLKGRLPDWIGGFEYLQMLDLDANKLTGSIPTWFGLLTGLNHLLLNRNELTGTLPSQMSNMRDLDVLLIDGNNFSGNANVVCESSSVDPAYFIADCYPGQDGQRPEIECRCCTTCCVDGDTECNNKKWTSNLDPVWTYGFVRQSYTFSLANAPAEYSKAGDQDDPNDPVDPLDR